MISLHAKYLESALLVEPHVAVMFSCRTLTRSAEVSCRTLQIAEPKAMDLEKDYLSGKSKGGLSKGGLGPKGANWAKKGPFGAISALPSWLWGAEELVPIGPEKARFAPKRPDFPGRIPPRFSLKIWGLSPRL